MGLHRPTISHHRPPSPTTLPTTISHHQPPSATIGLPSGQPSATISHHQPLAPTISHHQPPSATTLATTSSHHRPPSATISYQRPPSATIGHHRPPLGEAAKREGGGGQQEWWVLHALGERHRWAHAVLQHALSPFLVGHKLTIVFIGRGREGRG
jgi:hypothetical protein